MPNYNASTYAELVNAINTANSTTANDTIILQNDLVLSPSEVISLTTPSTSGTLRFRSLQAPGATTANPTILTLTVQNDLNVNDTTPDTPQPSLTIGPFALQIGNGTTAGSLTGNVRADDGGVLIFNRSVDTLYTGTISFEDSPNALLNKFAGTTVTLDGSAGTGQTTTTGNLAIRASQGSAAADPYILEIGGAGNGVISGVIGDGGLASAPGKLNKTGAGTWTFSGNNTYVGSTTVSAGTLVVANSSGLGATIGAGAGTTANPATAAAAGTVVQSGATLALQGGIAIGAEALSLAGTGVSGGGALQNLSGANSFGGPVTLTADTLIASNAGSLTLSGTVGGAFGLTLSGNGSGSITGAIQSAVTTVTKAGTGTWALSGNNAYAGGTSLNGGTLELGALSSAGTGGISFGAGAQALAVDVAGTLGNTISNFGLGDTLDLRTITANGATLSMSGTMLTVTEDAGSGSDSNTFNIGDALTGYRYALRSDGAGGTEVYLQDAVAPDTPAAPTLSASSDSGVVGDGITSDNTPTFTGTTEAGATVNLYEGNTLLGSAVANSSGAYAVTSTIALGDGDHTFSVTSADAVGNTSGRSTGTSINIDTTAPAAPAAPALSAASDTSVSNSDGITSVKTPTFTGTVDAGATVNLYEGQALLGTAVAGSDGTYQVTSTLSLGDGNHTFTVTSTDAAGNESVASSGTTINIDSNPPAAPSAPALTAASDSGASNSDGITNVTTPSFTGTAEAGSTVTLYNGNAALGSAVADSNGVYTVTVASPFAAGDYALSAKATDAAGNTSVVSGTANFTIDTTAPGKPAAPALTAASDTGPLDGITADTTPTFTGTVGAGETVTLYDGTTRIVGTATAGSDGSYTVTVRDASSLGDGAHNMYVRSTDLAGNTSAYSSLTRVVIDTAAPSAPSAPSLIASSDTGTSQTDGITRDATPTFTGTAEALSTVKLYNGNTLVGTARANGNGDYRITTSTLADGNYTLTTTATDRAGNESTISSATNVSIDTRAPTKPNAPSVAVTSDTGASSTDGITSDTTPTITGMAEAGTRVTLYDDGIKNPDGTRAIIGSTIAGSDGSYSITAPTLSDGTHFLRVKATDTAGNASTYSAGRRVVIDTTDPDVEIGNQSGTVTQRRQIISGTGEAGSRITLVDDDTEVNYGSTTVRADGTWSRAVTLEEGDNEIGAYAVDKAGNVASSDEILLVYEPPGSSARSFAAFSAPASADAGLTHALFNAAFAPGHAESAVPPAAADPLASGLAASPM